MRICNHCGKLTAGRPLFCNHCGRSFSVKFCPRLHPNSRDAEACSQCGSRELSIPQDRLPIRFRALMLFLSIIPGLALKLLFHFFISDISFFNSSIIPTTYLFPCFTALPSPLLGLSGCSFRCFCSACAAAAGPGNNRNTWY